LENINIFDIIVIALVVILGLKGLMKGFIKELFGLIGIVGGVFVASRLAKDVGDIVAGIFALENENTILLVGFIAGLIAFWIIAYIIGAILEKVFEASGLGILDRVFGFIFGAGKIFLLFAIIAYATTGVKVVNDNLAPKMKDSMVFPMLVSTGGFIIKLDTGKFSNDVKKEFNGAVESTKKTIQEISETEIKKKAIEVKEQVIDSVNNKE